MWSTGTEKINGCIISWEVKHFAECSVYGIDDGRISKLYAEINGSCVISYDRGWDVEPTCETAELLLCSLVKKYN